MNFNRFGRTANLFDYQTMAISETGMYLTSDGVEHSSAIWNISDFIPCDGMNFVLSKVGGTSPSICFYDENKNYISGQAYSSESGYVKIDVIATAASIAKYIRFSYLTSGAVDDLSAIMLNNGSTPLPYQPYIGWTDSHYIRVNGVWQPVASAHERTGGAWD